MKKLFVILSICFSYGAKCQNLLTAEYKKQPLKIIEKSISQLDCGSIDKLLQLRELHFHMIYSPADGKILSVKPNYELMKAVEKSNPNLEYNWEIIDRFSNKLQNEIKIKTSNRSENLQYKPDQTEVIILFLNQSNKFRKSACR